MVTTDLSIQPRVSMGENHLMMILDHFGNEGPIVGRSADLYALASVCKSSYNHTKVLPLLKRYFEPVSMMHSSILHDHYDQFMWLWNRFSWMDSDGRAKMPCDGERNLAVAYVAAQSSSRCLEFIYGISSPEILREIPPLTGHVILAAIRQGNVESVKILSKHPEVSRLLRMDDVLDTLAQAKSLANRKHRMEMMVDVLAGCNLLRDCQHWLGPLNMHLYSIDMMVTIAKRLFYLGGTLVRKVASSDTLNDMETLDLLVGFREAGILKHGGTEDSRCFDMLPIVCYRVHKHRCVKFLKDSSM